MNSPPIVQIGATPEATALAAAKLFASQAKNMQGIFTVAFSGGSTPKRMFQILAERYRDALNWSVVEVYFVDERCVPPDHADSNFRMAQENLLSKVPVPAGSIHRMKGELEPEVAASEYAQLLAAQFKESGPDLLFLGMGDDGHTASLFPHTPATKEMHRPCVGQFVENSTTGKSWRITLTAPFINRAAQVVALVTGANKADRLQEVLHGPRDPDRLPIQLIQPNPGKMLWLVDETAAAKLPK